MKRIHVYSSISKNPPNRKATLLSRYMYKCVWWGKKQQGKKHKQPTSSSLSACKSRSSWEYYTNPKKDWASVSLQTTTRANNRLFRKTLAPGI